MQLRLGNCYLDGLFHLRDVEWLHLYKERVFLIMQYVQKSGKVIPSWTFAKMQ